VAPRAGDRDGKMANPRRRSRNHDRGEIETGGPDDRQAGRRIPAGELGIERSAVARPYTKPILTPKGSRGGEYHVRRIDDSAGGSSAPLDLHDRWRDGRDGIGKLVRNVSQLHICTQVTSSCILMKHPLCLHDAASGEAIASPKRAANLRSAGLMSDFPPLPRLRWIRHSFSGTVGTSAR